MAKKKQPPTRQTNWKLIYGIIGVGALGLITLLIFSVFSDPEPVQAVTDLCETDPDACISIGDKSAPVTILEISDFGCPHCQTFHNNTFPILKETYVDTGEVNWLILPYSLWTQYTLNTANAAMCANEQDMYMAYADQLFTDFRSADEQNMDWLVANANVVGLDSAEFGQCVTDGRYIDLIQDNITAARRSQVSGTPSFFINGQRYRGQLDAGSFIQAIESAQ